VLESRRILIVAVGNQLNSNFEIWIHPIPLKFEFLRVFVDKWVLKKLEAPNDQKFLLKKAYLVVAKAFTARGIEAVDVECCDIQHV